MRSLLCFGAEVLSHGRGKSFWARLQAGVASLFIIASHADAMQKGEVWPAELVAPFEYTVQPGETFLIETAPIGLPSLWFPSGELSKARVRLGGDSARVNIGSEKEISFENFFLAAETHARNSAYGVVEIHSRWEVPVRITVNAPLLLGGSFQDERALLKASSISSLKHSWENSPDLERFRREVLELISIGERRLVEDDLRAWLNRKDGIGSVPDHWIAAQRVTDDEYFVVLNSRSGICFFHVVNGFASRFSVVRSDGPPGLDLSGDEWLKLEQEVARSLDYERRVGSVEFADEGVAFLDFGACRSGVGVSPVLSGNGWQHPLGQHVLLDSLFLGKTLDLLRQYKVRRIVLVDEDWRKIFRKVEPNGDLSVVDQVSFLNPLATADWLRKGIPSDVEILLQLWRPGAPPPPRRIPSIDFVGRVEISTLDDRESSEEQQRIIDTLVSGMAESKEKVNRSTILQVALGGRLGPVGQMALARLLTEDAEDDSCRIVAILTSGTWLGAIQKSALIFGGTYAVDSAPRFLFILCSESKDEMSIGLLAGSVLAILESLNRNHDALSDLGESLVSSIANHLQARRDELELLPLVVLM